MLGFLKRLSVTALVLMVALSFLSSGKVGSAQSGCPEGMVCTPGELPVPDIGPLPNSIRLPFGPKEELGKLLFCDHRLSADDKYACAVCHQPLHGFAEARQSPQGVGGLSAGTRNAPTLYNVGFNVAHYRDPVTGLPVLLWDGRARSLEEHVSGITLSPLKNPTEMGMANAGTIMHKLKNLPPNHKLNSQAYEKTFRQAFGPPGMTFDNLVRAIVAYERTIISADSSFDQYVSRVCGGRVKDCPAPETAAGAEAAQKIPGFGDKEQKGMVLFRAKAGCILCHNGPNFTDNTFHHVGWPAELQADGRWKYTPDGDVGRHLALVSAGLPARDSDMGAFKTPTLRSVRETWPYMHDGMMPDFEEIRTELDKAKQIEKALKPVVDFFNQGGSNNNPNKLMKELNLTGDQKSQLIAFLTSLTGRSLDKTMTDNCPFFGEDFP